MSENIPSTPAPQDEPKAGAKIIFVGVILVMVAIAFVLVNIRTKDSATTTFSVTADKMDATYYDFEMPIFRVEGARPGSQVTAELTHDGKMVARTASGVTIDAQGNGLIRGDLVTNENSNAYRGSWNVTVRGDGGEQASLSYAIVGGCSEGVEPTITTDKKEYRAGEEIHYAIKGSKNTQVRWFGVTGRGSGALNLTESDAYYGDVTNEKGEWKSSGIIAAITNPDATEAVQSSIVTLCDKTTQAKVTIRR